LAELNLYFSLHGLPTDILSPMLKGLMAKATVLVLESGIRRQSHELLERRLNEVLRGEKKPADVAQYLPPNDPSTAIRVAFMEVTYRHPSLRRIVFENSPLTKGDLNKDKALSEQSVDRWQPNATELLRGILAEQAALVLHTRDKALAVQLKNLAKQEPLARIVVQMGYGHYLSLPKCVNAAGLQAKTHVWTTSGRPPPIQLELKAKLAAGEAVSTDDLEDALVERESNGDPEH
jgi:hypothetical protein